jgi:hypothetical protein
VKGQATTDNEARERKLAVKNPMKGQTTLCQIHRQERRERLKVTAREISKNGDQPLKESEEEPSCNW